MHRFLKSERNFKRFKSKKVTSIFRYERLLFKVKVNLVLAK